MDVFIIDPISKEPTRIKNGLIRAYATSESEAQHANEDHEQMFTMKIDVTPTAIDDCVAFIQNGNEEDIVIDCLEIVDVGADMQIYIQLGDKGDRNAAAVATPTNLNSGSAVSANGKSVFETGVDLDGGAATIAGGAESHRYKALAAESHRAHDICGKIILKKNQTLTLWATVSDTILAFISLHYHQ